VQVFWKRTIFITCYICDWCACHQNWKIS